MDTHAETHLIAAVRRGNHDAARTLVEEQERSLWLYLFRMTGSRQVSEDLFQEIWARFFESLPRFRGQSRVRTYLLAIAHRLVVDARETSARQRARLEGLEHEVPTDMDIDRELLRDEERKRAQEVLQRLAPRQREVLILHYFEELTYEEVGAVLGIRAATARSYAQEALQRAGALLGSEVTT